MIELNSPPLADFDHPIDMLQDCHRRVERFLHALARTGSDAPLQLDDEWAALLRRALDYFATAAPMHTADEEESLFPRLRRHMSEPGVPETLALVALLEADHEAADPLHAEHERIGRAWLGSRRIEAGHRQRFVQLSESLLRMYRPHIEREDTVIFPVAMRVLTEAEQAEIGEEMRARRGHRSCAERIAVRRSSTMLDDDE